MLAAALQGVFRALDSGPLKAWYVETAQAHDPATGVEPTLAHAGTVLGVAIAAGACASGGLVAWHPVGSHSPLLLPFWLAVVANLVHLSLVALLVRERPSAKSEPGRTWRSVSTAPGIVVDGIRTLRTSQVLRSLVLVEVFWSVAMIAFETLNPVRLAEVVGGVEQAGALIGPVSAAAWGLFAGGAMAAGLASTWVGVGWAALLARLLNGAFVVLMGLAQGPVGLITAFLLSYTMHGAAGPMHSALLHRQAGPGNRTTVLSMNSMVAGGTYSVALLILAPLAEQTSTATAIIVDGAFSILGAALYIPAIRVERSAEDVSPPRAESRVSGG